VWNDHGEEGGNDIICPICNLTEDPISENQTEEKSKINQDSSRALYEILPKYENMGRHEKKMKFKALPRVEINKIQMGM
jgi:uncharacterized Zn finger protein (UPF0148 family)